MSNELSQCYQDQLRLDCEWRTVFNNIAHALGIPTPACQKEILAAIEKLCPPKPRCRCITCCPPKPTC